MAKKKVKYSYIVNLTNVEDIEDIRMRIICAKADAGIAVTRDDIGFAAEYGANVFADMYSRCLDEYVEENKKNVIRVHSDKYLKKFDKLLNEMLNEQEPWYKRWWKKIKSPFTKKN